MTQYTSLRDFFDEIKSSFQKLFGLLDGDYSDTTILKNTSNTIMPEYRTLEVTKFNLDYTKTIAYFIITFVLLIMGKEMGLATPSVTFLGISLTYTMLSTSLTSSSSFFILLEILAWTCIIELLKQMNFDNVSWLLVLLIPTITIMQSLFYLIFYLA